MSDRLTHYHAPNRSFWRTRYAVGFVAFTVIAIYFMWADHRAHMLGALPFLLVLACPLMHIFMHHGHRGESQAHPRSAGDGAETAARRDEGHP